MSQQASSLGPDKAGESSANADPHLAGGSLGVTHIVCMVMAAVAPAGGAVAIMPLGIALGVGIGTPGMFVVVGLVLILFSVGFTRMTPYVRNAGAFFAYITSGIGRPAGLAAAYVAMTAYLSIAAATGGAAGFFASLTLDQFFGIDIPWWILTAIMLVATFVLGYLRITMAAVVLGVALVTEAVVVLVLDVAILFQSGPGDFSFQSFNPTHVFSGAVGVGIIYGFACFQGFEGTAIYAEEAREPNRTIPRATYTAIIAITAFFSLTAWALVVGAGGDQAPITALKDPGNFTFNLSDQFVGQLWTDVLQVLIVTSSFAGMLAFHNAASRYLFALSRDGFMPASLSRIHPTYASPTVAGGVSFAVLMIIIMAFAAGGADPLTTLTAALTGLGAVGLLSLVTLTSLAVLLFFRKRGHKGWVYSIAPALATIALGASTVLTIVNYDSITGTSSIIINILPLLHLLAGAAGIIVALRTRARRPERYQQMGNTRVED